MRTILGRRSPTPKIFDHNPYGILERDKYISHKTPLQSSSFEKLTKASEFPTWEKRVSKATNSVPGYGDQLLNSHIPPNSIIQERILNFLIQVVYDTEGFDIFYDIESTPFDEYYTRGRDAWQSLCDNYQPQRHPQPARKGEYHSTTPMIIYQPVHQYTVQHDYPHYHNPVYQPSPWPPSVSTTQRSHNNSIHVSSGFSENDENYCKANTKVATKIDSSPASPSVPAI